MSKRRHHRPTRRRRADKRPMKRWHKNVIHGTLIVGIMFSLYFEGAKYADVLFLALSIATEVS